MIRFSKKDTTAPKQKDVESTRITASRMPTTALLMPGVTGQRLAVAHWGTCGRAQHAQHDEVRGRSMHSTVAPETCSASLRACLCGPCMPTALCVCAGSSALCGQYTYQLNTNAQGQRAAHDETGTTIECALAHDDLRHTHTHTHTHTQREHMSTPAQALATICIVRLVYRRAIRPLQLPLQNHTLQVPQKLIMCRHDATSPALLLF